MRVSHAILIICGSSNRESSKDTTEGFSYGHVEPVVFIYDLRFITYYLL